MNLRERAGDGTRGWVNIKRPSVRHGTFRFLLAGSLFTRDSGSDGRKTSVERASLVRVLFRKSPHRSDGRLTRRISKRSGNGRRKRHGTFHAQTSFRFATGRTRVRDGFTGMEKRRLCRRRWMDPSLISINSTNGRTQKTKRREEKRRKRRWETKTQPENKGVGKRVVRTRVSTLQPMIRVRTLSTEQRSESTRSCWLVRMARDRCLFLSIWDHLPRKFERKLRIRQRENRRTDS